MDKKDKLAPLNLDGISNDTLAAIQRKAQEAALMNPHPCIYDFCTRLLAKMRTKAAERECGAGLSEYYKDPSHDLFKTYLRAWLYTLSDARGFSIQMRHFHKAKHIEVNVSWIGEKSFRFEESEDY